MAKKKVLLCMYAGKKKIGCKMVSRERLRRMNRILEGAPKRKRKR